MLGARKEFQHDALDLNAEALERRREDAEWHDRGARREPDASGIGGLADGLPPPRACNQPVGGGLHLDVQVEEVAATPGRVRTNVRPGHGQPSYAGHQRHVASVEYRRPHAKQEQGTAFEGPHRGRVEGAVEVGEVNLGAAFGPDRQRKL